MMVISEMPPEDSASLPARLPARADFGDGESGPGAKEHSGL